MADGWDRSGERVTNAGDEWVVGVLYCWAAGNGLSLRAA